MANWTAQEFLNAWEVEHSKLDAKWHEEFLAHPITLKILAFESTEIVSVLNKKRLVEIFVDVARENCHFADNPPHSIYETRLMPSSKGLATLNSRRGSLFGHPRISPKQ